MFENELQNVGATNKVKKGSSRLKRGYIGENFPDPTEQQVNQLAEQSRQTRMKGLERGREMSKEVFNRDVQGLSPAERSAMQYEADRQIQRQMQSANRRLMGNQAERGISGKSGVAFAQQKELQRLANEAQGQTTRDLNKLNADRQMQNLAAMINLEYGEAGQAMQDVENARNRLQADEERRLQRAILDKLLRQNFHRI